MMEKIVSGKNQPKLMHKKTAVNILEKKILFQSHLLYFSSMKLNILKNLKPSKKRLNYQRTF